MTATTEENAGYLLMFRGTHWDKDLSPEEIQRVMSHWMEWFDGVTKDGKMVGSNPLAAEGKIVSGKGGRNVSDGPFAESKEAIAGYFLVKVDTLDEALAIAQKCPALEHGMTVEVRPVLDCCRPSQMVKEMQLAEALA